MYSIIWNFEIGGILGYLILRLILEVDMLMRGNGVDSHDDGDDSKESGKGNGDQWQWSWKNRWSEEEEDEDEPMLCCLLPASFIVACRWSILIPPPNNVSYKEPKM